MEHPLPPNHYANRINELTYMNSTITAAHRATRPAALVPLSDPFLLDREPASPAGSMTPPGWVDGKPNLELAFQHDIAT